MQSAFPVLPHSNVKTLVGWRDGYAISSSSGEILWLEIEQAIQRVVTLK